MNFTHSIAYFLGGALMANAIPHWVSGLMGRPFQSPFAKPPGKGLSSSLVNVLWAAFNLLLAWLLVLRVGTFDLRDGSDAAALGLGALLASVGLARNFGKLHGGNNPQL